MSGLSVSFARRRRVAAAGQTLIEFALVLPIFLMMVFGVIDAGRYVYMDSVLSQAAREGARVAAVEASWIGWSSNPSNPLFNSACNTTDGPVCPPDAAHLQADVLSAANRMVAPFGPIAAVYISCDSPANGAPTGNWTSGSACTGASDPLTPGTGATGNLVSVRVQLTFTPLTPVISQLFGSFTTSGSATMVIN
ncbi:MAG: pilus assembly protein [Chloroflexi bacterium]|nr:pilus assembly protein [Chloroflexota bacterium]